MKSESNQKIGKKKYLTKLKSCVMMGAALLLIAQTSCVWNSNENVKNWKIYQPSTLKLQKNVPIQTLDGVYTPQVNEIWHSDDRFRKVENELNLR